MKGWNPFSKIDTEIGSFLKASVFNKDYTQEKSINKEKNEDKKEIENK